MGKKGKPSLPDRPDGCWQSFGQHLAPRSLYLAQLKARFDQMGRNGAEAVQAITTSEQRHGAIWNALHLRFALSEKE